MVEEFELSWNSIQMGLGLGLGLGLGRIMEKLNRDGLVQPSQLGSSLALKPLPIFSPLYMGGGRVDFPWFGIGPIPSLTQQNTVE
jgi:hypothetical protein